MSRLTSTLHCSATPTLTVFDNHAGTVRLVQYNRSSAGQSARGYITRMSYTAQGQTRAVADPRFADPGRPQGSATPNFQYCHSLSGQILSSDSLDAGRVVSLPGADARPRCAASNGNGVGNGVGNGNGAIITRYTYDALGRLESVSETASAVQRISERIIYGQTKEDVAANRRGLPVSHLDTAGLLETRAYGLSGRPLAVARRLLADVDTDSNWTSTGADLHAPGLSGIAYTTRWRLSAVGEIIAREDARANVQSLAYDLRGALSAVLLRLAGEADGRALVTERTYTASGQIFDEIMGNGIVTRYRYEPGTQRPQQVRSTRSTRPARAKRAALLRDLRYTHDPVGNIVSIEDRAQSTDHFANQRTQPVQRYRYDALYQLTEATGRENAGRGAPGLSPKAAQAMTALPHGAAAGQLDSYTRRFDYDLGGNLTHIAHQGTTVQYTKDVVVAASSNRAVVQDTSTSLTAAQVNDRFDGRGNLLRAGSELALRWDSRNQLREAIILSRPNGLDDRETYAYDGGHMRVSKVMRRYGKIEQRDTVIYLPGLELRTREAAGQTEAATQVVLIDDAGGSRVRMLRWDSGQPAGISGDQLRVSLNDQIGSSSIELDDRADIISEEAYYPYGGTALQSSRSAIEAKFKYVRHAGKERDATGFYYYGWRYYLPCSGRWASADPSGPSDGLNLFRMTWNNPIAFTDDSGLGTKKGYLYIPFAETSIYKMAVGYNIVRSLNNKDPYEIIAENKAALNGYRAHLGAYIKDERNKKTGNRAPKALSDKWKPALMRLESPRLAESYLVDLSSVETETSKIYILGHGNAGISHIASDLKKQFIGGKWQSTREMLEADALAQLLSRKKLPAAFSDFRLVACQGANAIKATDLSNDVPVQVNGKIALGQRFADALSAAGFTKPIVTAYRGYGKIAAPELWADLFDHQKRSVDMASRSMTASSLRRNMEVRQQFTPGR